MMTEKDSDISKRLQQYKEDGFTIFENIHSQAFMDQAKEKLEQLSHEDLGGSYSNYWYGDMVEFAPQLMLPAVSDPRIIAFAELVMGPFVQVDNITLAKFGRKTKEEVGEKVSGWHRDRYAQIPRSDAFERPLSINAICYLQDLTDETGPLRIIRGSHRRDVRVEDPTLPHPEEELLYAKAGDVIFTHNGLLHSGTPNVSNGDRYFFSAYYNLTWLKHKDNFNGPNVQRIIAQARKRNDHRMLRLFGVDDQLEKRANSGFLVSDEARWQQWIEEDEAKLTQD